MSRAQPYYSQQQKKVKEKKNDQLISNLISQHESRYKFVNLDITQTSVNASTDVHTARNRNQTPTKMDQKAKNSIAKDLARCFR